MDEAIAKKIKNFFTQYKHHIYQKGEIIINADENPVGIFYLTKGLIKQYAISKKGDELVINVFKPIAFFPMSWAINQTPNAYYFEAVEEAEAWIAPREAVVQFIKDNPDVLFNLMSRVYKGTDGILMRMVYLMSGQAYTRVITELLIAGKRFGKKVSNGQTTLHLTEKDLATQAGVARETVSREIKKLKDKHLIKMDPDGYLMFDLDKLETELSAEE